MGATIEEQGKSLLCYKVIKTGQYLASADGSWRMGKGAAMRVLLCGSVTLGVQFTL